MMRPLCTLLLLCVSLLALLSPAAAEIVITGPGSRVLPLAIAPPQPLAPNQKPEIGRLFAETLRSDLEQSGLFALADPRSFLRDADQPGLTSTEVDFTEWRALSVDALVKSGFSLSGNELLVEARLYDVPLGGLLVGRRYRGKAGDERQMAHAFADQILKALTGTEGAFAGRIIYTGKKNGLKELYLSDSDGANPLPLTLHKSIIVAPDVSPSAREVVFTSYRNNRPELYRKEIYTGQEVKISGRKGVNIGGRFSPDGRSLLASLSFEGNPEIYLLGSDGSVQRRLTDNWAIDVDPAFSPDGNRIVFTSDRLGSPQLFLLDLAGGTPRRLANNGRYDASPAFSPDGERIVFSRLEEGRFEIYSIRPDGSDERRLSSGAGNKEHPRYSPDGRFILYDSDAGGGRALYVMRSDGTNPRRITPPGIEAGQGVWSRRW